MKLKEYKSREWCRQRVALKFCSFFKELDRATLMGPMEEAMGQEGGRVQLWHLLPWLPVISIAEVAGAVEEGRPGPPMEEEEEGIYMLTPPLSLWLVLSCVTEIMLRYVVISNCVTHYTNKRSRVNTHYDVFTSALCFWHRTTFLCLRLNNL